MNTKFYYLVLTWISLFQGLLTAFTLSDEKRLIKHLLENYERVGKIGRPVYNTSETTRVSLGLALIQILDVDEIEQTLTTSVWQRFLWKDFLLQWSREDFGGVDHIRVPASNIWMPDIVLYNSADEKRSGIKRNPSMAVVSSDGTVLYIPPMIYKSVCAMDLTYYPRDTQTCRLKFGSWTYDGFKLDVDFYDHRAEIDMTNYIINNEWEVLAHSAKKNVKYYPCCKEPYPDITFNLTIRRISTGYGYFTTLPIALISLVNLLLFLLPTKSTAKLNLGMFVFFMDFALIWSFSPLSLTTPLPNIVSYLAAGMVLSILSMMLSIITINLANRRSSGNPLTHIVNKICGTMMCVNVETGLINEKSDQKVNTDHDWEIFATVLDRIFFIIYLFLFVLLAITISMA